MKKYITIIATILMLFAGCNWLGLSEQNDMQSSQIQAASGSCVSVVIFCATHNMYPYIFDSFAGKKLVSIVRIL